MDSADAACVACAHKEELIKEYRAQSAHDADAADRLRQETAAIRGKYLEHQALAARARASSIDSGGRDDAYAEKTAALAAALAAAEVQRTATEAGHAEALARHEARLATRGAAHADALAEARAAAYAAGTRAGREAEARASAAREEAALEAQRSEHAGETRNAEAAARASARGESRAAIAVALRELRIEKDSERVAKIASALAQRGAAHASEAAALEKRFLSEAEARENAHAAGRAKMRAAHAAAVASARAAGDGALAAAAARIALLEAAATAPESVEAAVAEALARQRVENDIKCANLALAHEERAATLTARHEAEVQELRELETDLRYVHESEIAALTAQVAKKHDVATAALSRANAADAARIQLETRIADGGSRSPRQSPRAPRVVVIDVGEEPAIDDYREEAATIDCHAPCYAPNANSPLAWSCF